MLSTIEMKLMTIHHCLQKIDRSQHAHYQVLYSLKILLTKRYALLCYSMRLSATTPLDSEMSWIGLSRNMSSERRKHSNRHASRTVRLVAYTSYCKFRVVRDCRVSSPKTAHFWCDGSRPCRLHHEVPSLDPPGHVRPPGGRQSRP